MKYSVVMPCFFNREDKRETVVQTLESLKATMPEDSELIVVDDGSTLPSGFLREYADTYVRQPNQGISRAWNAGMLLARGEYVAIVNDDIRVPEKWLDVLAGSFEFYPDCGVSGGTGGPTHQPLTFKTVGSVREHVFFPGYCFMLKKDRFYEPFDEKFKTNCGDCDYWHRVRKAGLSLYKAPISVWHKEGDTLHAMDYSKITEESIAAFKAKHGIDPQGEYYS